MPHIRGRIEVDGSLDDEGWRYAEQIGEFVEIVPGELAEPEVQTNVLLGFDEDNLYVGFICYENDMSELRATIGERDRLNGNEDHVCLLLDPFNTEKGGYGLWLNPCGVQVDYYHQEDLEQFDWALDLVWNAATEILEDRWVAEIAIPLSSLRFPPGTSHQWAADFQRYRPRESQYVYSWKPHPRGETYTYANLGSIRIEESLGGSGRMSFLPYFVGGAADTPWGNDHTTRLGFTGKYRVKSDMVLDWAVHPDYSQIETDEALIDVNTTFALYYPEKRPFFLERKEFFDTPIQAVFTRAINDPIVAVKLTGRAGGTDIGYIGALDEHTPWVVPLSEQSFSVASDENSVSNILRLERNLPNEANLGLLFTSRESEASFNRVAGIDGRSKFLEHYYCGFQWLSSWTKEPDDTSIFAGYPWLNFGEYTPGFNGESFRGEAFSADLCRRGKHLDFTAVYRGFSPGVRLDNGFLSSNDLRDARLDVGVTVWPEETWIEDITFGEQYRDMRTYDGDHKANHLKSSISLTLERQNYLTFEYTRGAKSYMGRRLNGTWDLTAMWISQTLKWMAPSAIFTYAKDIDYFAYPPSLGRILLVGLTTDINVARRLKFTLGTQRYLLWNQDIDDPTYDMTVLNTRVLLSLSRYLNFRTTVQYSSSEPTESFLVVPLVSLELTPFSVFYLGSNHRYERTTGAYSNQGDVYFLKLQYLFEM